MTSTIIIDRIENNLAIIESIAGPISIPISLLPPKTKEGDAFTMSFSKTDTTSAQEEATTRLERLKKRDSGDDIIDL